MSDQHEPAGDASKGVLLNTARHARHYEMGPAPRGIHDIAHMAWHITKEGIVLIMCYVC